MADETMEGTTRESRMMHNAADMLQVKNDYIAELQASISLLRAQLQRARAENAGLREVCVDLLDFVVDCNPQDPDLINDEDECPADHPNCCGRCEVVHRARTALARPSDLCDCDGEGGQHDMGCNFLAQPGRRVAADEITPPPYSRAARAEFEAFQENAKRRTVAEAVATEREHIAQVVTRPGFQLQQLGDEWGGKYFGLPFVVYGSTPAEVLDRMASIDLGDRALPAAEGGA